jgi:hypothetical protein
MNTTGVQNYLSNVFQPIYTFDAITSTFLPKLELSNIDTYSGNTVSVFTAAVGDSNSNVYVGSNAGNLFNFTRNCSNVTALGFGAGSNISNVTNSVYIGWYAGAGGSNISDTIAIGSGAAATRSANIFLGTETGTTGESNIFIGHYISPSNVSNQIRIGYSNQIPIAADLSRNWVGIGGFTTPVFANEKLDVSGNLYVLGTVGINTEPGVTTTLDVNGNFQSDDGEGLLRFKTTATESVLSLSNYVSGTAALNIAGLTTSTTGYSSIQGSVEVDGASETIGTLKKGILLVSAVSQTDSAERAAYVYFAWTLSNVTALSATSNSTTDIALSTSNIQISNGATVHTYDYSITYFPLP